MISLLRTYLAFKIADSKGIRNNVLLIKKRVRNVHNNLFNQWALFSFMTILWDRKNMKIYSCFTHLIGHLM